MYYGVKHKNVAVVNALLEAQSIDVNLKAKHGYRPFHVAAYYGYVEIANKLIEHGCKINEKDVDGDTPLHLAVLGNHIKVCKVLLTHKDIQVNEENDEGKKAFDIASDIGLQIGYE